MKVMVVVAHPDDAEFGCAGTIAKWAKEGQEIRYIVCTSGDKGSKDNEMTPHRLAGIREEEQLLAAKILGVREVIFLRRSDGEIEANLSFRAGLALLFRHFRPNILFTHDPWRLYLVHPDHRAVGIAAVDAVVTARDHLFLPEQLAIGLRPHTVSEIYLFHSDNSNYWVDIGETMERKIEALGQHKSQLAHIANWEERVRQWAIIAGQKAGVLYAEAFRRISLF